MAFSASPAFGIGRYTGCIRRAAASARRVCVRSVSPGVVPVHPNALLHELDDSPFYSFYPLDRKTEWRRDTKTLGELLRRCDLLCKM
jgi:hypothetical protein